jgi:hypothetical protein
MDMNAPPSSFALLPPAISPRSPNTTTSCHHLTDLDRPRQRHRARVWPPHLVERPVDGEGSGHFPQHALLPGQEGFRRVYHHRAAGTKTEQGVSFVCVCIVCVLCVYARLLFLFTLQPIPPSHSFAFFFTLNPQPSTCLACRHGSSAPQSSTS